MTCHTTFMTPKDREETVELIVEALEKVVMPPVLEIKDTINEFREETDERFERLERKLDATISRVDTHSRQLRI